MGTLRWTARILGLIILVIGLMFYFGYGNPLPFINPDYSLWENITLTALPLVFVGLALGWWREKVGGYLVIVPLLISLILSWITGDRFSMNLLVALIPGVLYLVVGYGQKRKASK
jgi:hypothetical protein